mgnify:FL=1|tara:strand:+ start:379 stop:558 length:180 start_codon:yes stop_codon:yes gene_type:complete
MNIKKAKYRYYGSETEPVSIRVELNDSNIVLGVPLNPANTDYQAILKWVAEGNKIVDED